jgi:hypothetical protein
LRARRDDKAKMTDFAQSTYLVDLVLAVVAVETIALVLLWRWRRRGVAPAQLLPNLAAGVFLLLALRGALSGASWIWLAACLAAAGLANAADLRQRWR